MYQIQKTPSKISDQCLSLLESKTLIKTHRNKKGQKNLFNKDCLKTKKSQKIRLNTFSPEGIKKQHIKQPQHMNDKALKKRLSTYGMSTKSSFAKLVNFSKQQQCPLRQRIRSSQNFRQKRIKTNPQQPVKDRKSSQNVQKCLSCKKIKDIIEDEKKKGIVQSIQFKLKTKNGKKWEQRYLKRRVESISRISHTINQMSQLLSLESSLKISKLFDNQNDIIEKEQRRRQMNQQSFEDNIIEQSNKSQCAYEKFLNQKSLTQQKQPELNLPIHSDNLKNNNKSHSDINKKSVSNTKQANNNKSSRSFYKTHSLSFNRNKILTQSLKKNKNLQQTTSLNITQFLHTKLSYSQLKQSKSITDHKLQKQTVYTNFTKHKTHTVNTLSSFQATILQGKRNNNDEESLIHELRQRRTASKLQKQPKQWHFYNLTNLNKIQLYQTKLNVSAQSWLAMDYLEMKYLRGWNVKKTSDKTLIGLRLGIFKCFQRLTIQKGLDLAKINVRVNYQSIKNQVTFITCNKMTIKNTKLMEQGFTLRNHTIISIEGLLIGMCKVEGCWDLILWLVQVCGYLQLKIQQDHVSIDEIHNEVVYFKDKTNLSFYAQTFLNMFTNIAEELQLDSTKIFMGYIHCPKIESNLIDLSILFMSCMKFQLFNKICTNKVSNDVPIKYQVGWNHWQHRVHTFKSSFNKITKIGAFGWMQKHYTSTTSDYVQNLKEEDVLIYQPYQKTVIIINAAKVNLGMCDVSIIDEWVCKTFKRFYKQTKGSSSKLCQSVSKQKLNTVLKGKSKIKKKL